MEELLHLSHGDIRERLQAHPSSTGIQPGAVYPWNCLLKPAGKLWLELFLHLHTRWGPAGFAIPTIFFGSMPFFCCCCCCLLFSLAFLWLHQNKGWEERGAENHPNGARVVLGGLVNVFYTHFQSINPRFENSLTSTRCCWRRKKSPCPPGIHPKSESQGWNNLGFVVGFFFVFLTFKITGRASPHFNFWAHFKVTRNKTAVIKPRLPVQSQLKAEALGR